MPATRLGTVWKDWRERRALAARRRRTSPATSFSAISGFRDSRPRTSLAGSASRVPSVIDSAEAERRSPSSIASSPKISPGPSVASVIARPSECSRVTRKLPS